MAEARAAEPDRPLPESDFGRFAAETLVLIPAYNEEECVGAVVERLLALGFRRVRVVSNGSTDNTASVASAAGAEVQCIPGRGYGLACHAGAESLPGDVGWLLYCNADASDDFSAYPEFAKAASHADFILGARLHSGDRRTMSPAQRFGNWLAPMLIHLIWRYRFHDLGPQRAIRVGAYRKLGMLDRGFGWTVEMQVRAVEEQLRIREIPVRTFARPAGEQKISGTIRGSFSAGVIILQTIARLALARRVGNSHPPAQGQ